MLKFGLVGGTGPAATVHYYLNIIQHLQTRKEDKHLPRLVIDSVDPVRIFNFVRTGDEKGLSAYLLETIQNLYQAGAKAAAFTGMTPHSVFKEVHALSPISLVHIMDGVIEDCRRLNFRKLLLVGSNKTMCGGFAAEPFLAAGIEVVIPNEQERNEIQHITEEEIEFGQKTEENVRHFIKLISHAAQRECTEAVVLANTDLPTYLAGEELSFKTLDPVVSHIRKISDAILSE